MRTARHDDLGTEPAARVAGRTEMRERCKPLARPTVTVRVVHPRQMNSGSSHIRCIEFEVAEIMVDAGGPAPDVSGGKILCDTGAVQQLHVARRERVEVVLKPY